MGEYADMTLSGFMGSVKPRKRLFCNRCKSSDVYWNKTPQGWRLFDPTGQHTCHPVSAEEPHD